MKSALTVATNIKLSFLNDRDPPFHTGRPPADVAEDEAEEVGGCHIESHHYLGLVGERKGREAEHTFSYLHRPQLPAQAQPLGFTAPKATCHSARRGQAHRPCGTVMAQPSLLGTATKGTTCLRGSEHIWKMLWHNWVVWLPQGTHHSRGKVLRSSCFCYRHVAFGLHVP